MKTTLFFCSVLALAASKPGGYYHQEYNYKTSSSSFKNNELQHKNENEGSYSKDGDLDGIVKPKIKSHSQKSEYVNPRLLSGSSNYQGGYSSGSNANYLASSDRLFGNSLSHHQAGGAIDGSYSSGNNANYLASSDRLFGNSLSNHQAGGAIDGYASSDRVLDLSNIYTPSGYQGNRGSSTGYRVGYGATHGNYETSQAGSNYGGSGSYGYSHGGTGYGYSNQGSTHEAIGSYGTNTDLTTLLQRLQNDMTRQLQTAINEQYKASGYTTSISSSQMSADVRTLEDELRRNLTRQLDDSLRSRYGQQESTGTNSYTISSGRPSTVANYNNQELAELRRQVEDNLIKKLHQGVRTTYNTESMSSYASSNNYMTPAHRPSYGTPSNIQYTPIPNPETITQIASRIQSNINLNLDNALHNIYEKYLSNDRSYYTMSDFDSEVNRIKDDIVRNLTSTMDDQLRTNYGQQVLKGEYYYSVSSTGETNPQYNYNVRDLDSLRRQVEDNLVKKLNETIRNYREQYQRRQSYSVNTNYYTSTSRPAYYTSNVDYTDLQRQLSQQLQNALSRRDYGSYSSSSSYNPQSYQMSLDELAGELQRNLTEQLNNYRHSSSSSSYGYSTSSNTDFENMKNQLQNQLMKQLQQGLQKQYQFSASASYSASSSSSSNSNFGSGHTYPTHSNYMECCGGRRKRDLSYRRYGHDDVMPEIPQELENQVQNEDDLAQQLESGHTGRLRFTDQELTRQQTEDDFSQQLQLSGSKNNDQQLTQQLEDDFGQKLQFPRGQMKQNIDNEDQQLTQQVEDEFGQKLELSGGQRKQNVDQELTQQLEDDFTQKLQLSGGQKKQNLDQQLTQQLEDDDFQKLQLSGGQKKQNVDQELTEQLEDDLQQKKQNFRNKDQQLTQQLEFSGGQKQQQLIFDNQQLTQQLEDDSSQKLQLSSGINKKNFENQDQQLNQHLKDDLTQQLELGNHPKNNEQQIEDMSQKLELENHKPKHVEQQFVDQDNVQELEVPKPKNAYTLGQQPEVVQQELETNQVVQGCNLEQKTLIIPEVKIAGEKLELSKPKKLRQYNEQFDQNQDDLTQQLELENPQRQFEDQQSKLINQKLEPLNQQLDGQQVQEQDLTQQLEFSHHKFEPQNHQLVGQQEQEDLTHQLELSNHKLGPQNEQLFGQQVQEQEDLTQQLELTHHKLEPQNQELVGQQEQEDLTQQIELSSHKLGPQNKQLVGQQAQEQDDLTQQLELTNHKFEQQNKQLFGQQAQEQDDLTQQLELTNHKLEPQNKQLVEQEQDDLTQQLELTNHKFEPQNQQVIEQQLQEKDDLSKSINKNELTQQLELENQKPIGKLELDNTVDQLELTTITNQKPAVKKLEEDAQQLQVGQQFQDENALTQQMMELDNTNKLEVEQQIAQQFETQPGSYKNIMRPGNYDQQGQQIEDDFTPLEVSGHKPQVDVQPVEDVNQSELSGSSTVDKNDVSKHTRDGQSVKIHGAKSSYGHQYTVKHTHITQVNQPVSTMDYDASASHGIHYTHSGERAFTNAHSGFQSQSQFSEDNYRKALKQQDALLDLLKQKIHEQSTQGSYGQHTLKKTVYVNSVPVDSLESRPIRNPNIEFVQNGDAFHNFPSSNTRGYGTHFGEMETMGPNLHQTYHIESPYQQRQFSGQSTRRVIHYVNGVPIDGVEKIKLIKPNGEIVETEHKLPVNGHLYPYPYGYSSNHYAGRTEQFGGYRSHGMNENSPSVVGSMGRFQENEEDILRSSHRHGLGIKQHRQY